jgi:microcystin-dependent protein
MATPFLGEIRVFTFNFAPKGWALCNGQILPINQNQALFALLGTMYGGDGRTTFALPNLQGRVPLHADSVNYYQGATGGEENHTLNLAELPTHTHPAVASSNPADQAGPAGNFWALESANAYSGAANSTMDPATIQAIGGSQPHVNLSPYLTLNFCIALQGIFPSRN